MWIVYIFLHHTYFKVHNTIRSQALKIFYFALINYFNIFFALIIFEVRFFSANTFLVFSFKRCLRYNFNYIIESYFKYNFKRILV